MSIEICRPRIDLQVPLALILTDHTIEYLLESIVAAVSPSTNHDTRTHTPCGWCVSNSPLFNLHDGQSSISTRIMPNRQAGWCTCTVDMGISPSCPILESTSAVRVRGGFPPLRSLSSWSPLGQQAYPRRQLNALA